MTGNTKIGKAVPADLDPTFSFGCAAAADAAHRRCVPLHTRYRLLYPIGAGGMGVVFEGVDLALDRPVAVKVLPEATPGPLARCRFLRELACQARLNHPNLVPAYDGGECPTLGLYIAMPLVRGDTLLAWLAKRRAAGARPDVRAAAGFALDIAAGLACVHGEGMMHRDVKPSNVLVSDGKARLFDFGLARLVADDGHLTAPNTVVGSRPYMSREQALGLPGVDHRTDVYALGVVCWEMLTGCSPTGCAATRPPLPSAAALNGDVPPVLSALVERLTHPDAGCRINSACEVVHACQQIIRRLPAGS